MDKKVHAAISFRYTNFVSEISNDIISKMLCAQYLDAFGKTKSSAFEIAFSSSLPKNKILTYDHC